MIKKLGLSYCEFVNTWFEWLSAPIFNERYTESNAYNKHNGLESISKTISQCKSILDIAIDIIYVHYIQLFLCT